MVFEFDFFFSKTITLNTQNYLVGLDLWKLGGTWMTIWKFTLIRQQYQPLTPSNLGKAKSAPFIWFENDVRGIPPT